MHVRMKAPARRNTTKLMDKLLNHKSNISKNQAQMGLFVIITG